MIGALHRVRRSEEGQALVLAAIFGLVLMLSVLGTVNLGRTVYQKVQLQAAADAAAYSQAALEARVMNFTAYTNRAMVVHYASVMAATSYLTWLHFIWAGLKPLLQVLDVLPYIGPIAAAIENGLGALMRLLDAGIPRLRLDEGALGEVVDNVEFGVLGSALYDRAELLQPRPLRAAEPP